MIKKRLVSLLTALAAVITLLAPLSISSAAAERAPITLTVSNAEGECGSSVTVEVSVSGNKGLNGMQFRVTYDPLALQVSRDENETYANQFGDYSAVNFGDGYVEFLATDTSTYKRNGVLAVLTFTVLEAGEHTVALEADAARGDCFYYLDGTDMVDLRYSFVDGTVTGIYVISRESDFIYELTADDTPLNRQPHVLLSMLNPPADVYGFSVEILYDPDALLFESGEFSALFPYGRAVSLTPGVVRVFAATEITAPASDDAPMADLTFTVIDPDKAVGSTYDFSIRFYNGQPAYTRVDHATVNLTEVYTIDAVLTLTEPEITVLPNDLNNDGVVSILDVSLLLDVLSGNAVLPDGISPDVNGDGELSIRDVSALLDVLAA